MGEGDASRSAPLGLTLIPLFVLVAVASILGFTHQLFGLIGRWGPPAGHVLVFAACVVAYRISLPALARAVDARRELIVTELS